MPDLVWILTWLAGALVGLGAGFMLGGLSRRRTSIKARVLSAWTCRGCGRTFDDAQPFFVDAAELAQIACCVDCSH